MRLQQEKEEEERKSSPIFTELTRLRLKDIERKKAAYTWGAPDYKIYPSQLIFGICPISYLKAKESYSGISDVLGSFRTRRGSAIHEEIQKDLLWSKKLYPLEKLNISAQDTVVWPEIPFWDKKSGISGRLDLMWDLDGPVPVELKTTSKIEKAWNELKPDSSHRCQASIYCEELMQMGIVQEPIKQFMLVYVNSMMRPEDPAAYKEFFIPYDDKLQTKTRILIEHLTLARQDYIKDSKDLVCKYPGCVKHRKKKEK